MEDTPVRARTTPHSRTVWLRPQSLSSGRRAPLLRALGVRVGSLHPSSPLHGGIVRLGETTEWPCSHHLNTFQPMMPFVLQLPNRSCDDIPQAHIGSCSKFPFWHLANFSEKTCNPFASSFAKLSRSLFSHVGQLGVSSWIPTFEKPNCIWAFI